MKKILIVIAVLLRMAVSSLCAETAPSRPNIVLILADDWSWPHASVLGDETVKTPTFDRIASEGVIFRNAHVAAPSCAPSRAAILTGQDPWRLKQGANLCGFIPAEFRIYPDLLEEAGYRVGCAGKGYDPGDYRGREREPAGPYFDNLHHFLEDQPEDQPFCFWLGSRFPHRPYWENQNKVSSENLKVPPFLPDAPDVRKDIAAYLHEVQEFDRQAGEAIEALESFGRMENTMIIITSDNGWPFPRAKATCYLEGTRVPLAIRWTGNIPGGRTLDDFTSLIDLAPTFLEAAGVAVPEQMTGQSLLPVLRSDKEGQVDPARTHLITGMERHTWRRSHEGQRNLGYPIRTLVTERFHFIRNFRPELWPAGDPPEARREPIAFNQWRNITFIGYSDVDSGFTKAYFGLNRDKEELKPLFELSFGKRPARELYDLQNDPYEMANLADDPRYADVLERMEAQLMRELEEMGDPRVTGDGDLFNTYPIIKDTDAQQIKPTPGKK